jgi:hypothetical protein
VSPHPLQVGGATVLLAGRRPDGSALVCYADRGGNPTSGFRIVMAHELRGVGWHMGAIKAAIAASPEILFSWELPPPARSGGGRLFVDHAIPATDR